jgi:putative ABC transport system permease protein
MEQRAHYLRKPASWDLICALILSHRWFPAISTMFYLDDEAKFGLRAVEGRPLESREQWTAMKWASISGDYLQALGVPLVRGRFFTNQDTKETTPVVVINETMAHRYWLGDDPIGKGTKGFDPRGRNDEWVRVIGVVKDMHSSGLERSPVAQIYEAQAQSLDETENLVVRTDATVGVLRDTIRSLDNTAVLTDVTTLGERLKEQNAPRRFEVGPGDPITLSTVTILLAGIALFACFIPARRATQIDPMIALRCD